MFTRSVKSCAGLAVALLLTVFAPAAAAPFDAHRCLAIGDVEVPYDVSLAADRIVFKSAGKVIVVSPGYVEVNGHRFADPELAGSYYRDTRDFLGSARTFPQTAADFGKSALLPVGPNLRENFLSGSPGCAAQS
jgi:hypothetical protein